MEVAVLAILAILIGIFAGLAIQDVFWIRDLLNRPKGPTTGAEALVGKKARASTDFSRSTGMVKISGEVWRARLAPGCEVELRTGDLVEVQSIDGLTLEVAPESKRPKTVS